MSEVSDVIIFISGLQAVRVSKTERACRVLIPSMFCSLAACPCHIQLNSEQNIINSFFFYIFLFEQKVSLRWRSLHQDRVANNNTVKKKKQRDVPFFHVLPISNQDRCEKIVRDNIKKVKVQQTSSELTVIERAANYSSDKLRGNGNFD